MRHCPVCRRAYSDAVKFCPEDGTALPPAADPLIGARLLDQFELREPCGSGSMGTVYRAWQTTMQRDVAVKVLRGDLADNPRVRKRFFREARAVARVAHPNIVSVHVVGELPDGRPFLVMEYVEGESLEHLCQHHGPLPAVRAIHIGRQIAAALAEAHGNGIIHRDLKPANILVGDRRASSDVVTVVDFGIAKILYEDGESNLTQTGAIFGTPSYISPEQAVGEPLDGRSDLYALGVVLYQMVTGRVPFESADGMEVLIKHLKQPPQPPRQIVPSLPERLEHTILRALRKDRTERWQTAEAFAAALLDAFTHIRSEALSTPPQARTDPGADSPADQLAQHTLDETAARNTVRDGETAANRPETSERARRPAAEERPSPNVTQRASTPISSSTEDLEVLGRAATGNTRRLRRRLVLGPAAPGRGYLLALGIAVGLAAGLAFARMTDREAVHQPSVRQPPTTPQTSSRAGTDHGPAAGQASATPPTGRPDAGPDATAGRLDQRRATTKRARAPASAAEAKKQPKQATRRPKRRTARRRTTPRPPAPLPLLPLPRPLPPRTALPDASIEPPPPAAPPPAADDHSDAREGSPAAPVQPPPRATDRHPKADASTPPAETPAPSPDAGGPLYELVD